MKNPRTKEEWQEFIPAASVTRVKRKPRSRKKAAQADTQYILDNIVRTGPDPSANVDPGQLDLFPKLDPTEWDPNI